MKFFYMPYCKTFKSYEKFDIFREKIVTVFLNSKIYIQFQILTSFSGGTRRFTGLKLIVSVLRAAMSQNLWFLGMYLSKGLKV